MSAVAKACGVVAGLVYLFARILACGYDGLAFAVTLVILGALIAPPLLDAIDDASRLPRLSDPRPFPHERGRQ